MGAQSPAHSPPWQDLAAGHPLSPGLRLGPRGSRSAEGRRFQCASRPRPPRRRWPGSDVCHFLSQCPRCMQCDAKFDFLTRKVSRGHEARGAQTGVLDALPRGPAPWRGGQLPSLSQGAACPGAPGDGDLDWVSPHARGTLGGVPPSS